jgi:hypothetical protein
LKNSNLTNINIPIDVIKFIDDNESPDKFLSQIVQKTELEIEKMNDKNLTLNNFKKTLEEELKDFF